MKKNIFYIYAFLLIAGFALVACSEEENIGPTVGNQQAQQVYTFTVTATKGDNAMTRALSYDGSGALIATWATTESVYAYDRTSSYHPYGTLTPLSNGATTILSGTMTDGQYIEKYDNIKLTFPRTPIDYTGQDGTLETIATKYDYAVGYATVSGVSENSFTASPVTFENQQAIVKFTLKDATSGDAINAQSVTISDGGTGIELDGNSTPTKGDLTITPSPVNNVVYAALRGVKNSNLTITATDGTSNYTYMKNDVTFENGKYYEINVKMKKDVTLALTAETGAIAIAAGEHAIISGIGGSDTHITIADGAIVTLDNVVLTSIPNNTNHQWAGLTCEGNATIILKDGTTNKIKGGYEDYPGIFIAKDKTVTIKGSTGSLEVSSNGFGCGIGAGYGRSCGNIVIEGGNITAMGGTGCAAIGGSQQNYSCGDITLNGGIIKATGGTSSPGIGAGNSSKCGNITITGGNITSNGQQYAAGIGSGSYAECGNITISGGTIDATGNYGPGIGSGHQSAKCGDILISGGDVKTKGTGGNFTGLGCGYSSTCGSITVTDGTTKLAIYGDIGKGSNGSSCGTVTIDGNEFISTSQTFPHYTTSTVDGYWTLTHK